MHLDCEGSHKVSAAVLGPVISPVNFSLKWLLSNLDMPFLCAGSHKVFWAHSGPRHFFCNFPSKVALLMCLVTCGHAFRLRRLAQSVRPRSGLNLGRGIVPVNFRVKWLF